MTMTVTYISSTAPLFIHMVKTCKDLITFAHFGFSGRFLPCYEKSKENILKQISNSYRALKDPIIVKFIMYFGC
jgi:hypothetical protein